MTIQDRDGKELRVEYTGNGSAGQTIPNPWPDVTVFLIRPKQSPDKCKLLR